MANILLLKRDKPETIILLVIRLVTLTRVRKEVLEASSSTVAVAKTDYKKSKRAEIDLWSKIKILYYE